MPTIQVNLSEIGAGWTKACKKAVADLNVLFKKKGIDIVLSLSGSEGPAITVKTDSSIIGTLVHGKTNAEIDGSGRMLSAVVRLPLKVIISTPSAVRDAGPGVLEVIVAHEFIHALGQEKHNSHLMAQTWTKLSGDTPAGDVLQAGGLSMPPLDLAPESVELLTSLWN
ncbi:hypothetical protein ACYOEI_09350 [Singulisphaera rosea]